VAPRRASVSDLCRASPTAASMPSERAGPISVTPNYQFTDFNSETVNYPGGSIDYDQDGSIYRGSLIYRF
jgi:hypothetical protein